MKKSFRLSAFLFFITIPLWAAPNPKGMIIRNTDTLYVTFIIPVTGPNYLNLQDSVRYLDHLKNECYLSPDDAKEYRFEYKGKLIRMISCMNTLSLDPDRPLQLFLQLEIDGPLKLFKYYTSSYGSYSSGPGGTSIPTGGQSSKHVLKMGSEEMFLYGDMNFNNDAPVFFKKCPELVKMIEEKVYSKKDIEAIVNYYNTIAEGIKTYCTFT